MIFNLYFLTIFLLGIQAIKITQNGNTYQFQGLNKLNYFVNPLKEQQTFTSNQTYKQQYSFFNPVFLKNPQDSVNISLEVSKQCVLPVACVRNNGSPKIQFKKNGDIVTICDQTNFDFFGLKNSTNIENFIQLDVKDLENVNLQTIQFKKKLKKYQSHQVMIFCLHFNSQNFQSLDFKIRFITNMVTTSVYIPKIKYYKEEFLRKEIPVKIFERKQKHIRFQDNFKQIQLKFKGSILKQNQIFLTFKQNQKNDYLFVNQKVIELYDVQNLVIKFINLSETTQEFNFSVDGFVQKPFGYKFEQEQEDDTFFLIQFFLIFFTIWILTVYQIISFRNFQILIKTLKNYLNERLVLEIPQKQDKLQSNPNFSSPDKIFSKRTIESNNKIQSLEFKEFDELDDNSWSSCCTQKSLESIFENNESSISESDSQKIISQFKEYQMHKQ